MQVKVCPKCNSENKETNSACSSCYASLDGVPLTESTKQEEIVQSAPQQDAVAPPAPPPSQPVEKPGGMPSVGPAGAGTPPQPEAKPGEMPSVGPGAGGGASSRAPGGPVGVGDLTSRGAAGQPPSPYGPAHRPTVGGPPIGQERPRRSTPGPNIGGILFALIVIGGAAFGGWWFFLKGPEPEQVVQQFFEAAKANDLEKVKPYLSSSDVKLLDAEQKRGRSGNFNIMGSGNEKIKTLGTTYEGADKSTAIVKIEPEDKSKLQGSPITSIDFVLIKEEGKWKIDLTETGKRFMQVIMQEIKKKGFPSRPGGGQLPR